ncbi:MAG: phosphoribosyl-ATP diphosphatase [Cocleimonas sp.]|nr:phosphoribosyl-ATP diphosphatase [Cocleimonas sp.]
MSNNATLSQIADILEQRKSATSDGSYVAMLYDKGLDQILKKIGEEATEVVMAAKDASVDGKTDNVIYEVADLWFHTLILLAQQERHPNDVLQELARRFGTSGLVEKASRKQT